MTFIGFFCDQHVFRGPGVEGLGGFWEFVDKRPKEGCMGLAVFSRDEECPVAWRVQGSSAVCGLRV